MKESPVNEWAMKSKTIIYRTLLAFALFSIFLTSQPMHTQNAPGSSQSSQAAQPPAPQPVGQNVDQNAGHNNDQNADQSTAQQTFTAVIAKSGDKIVLTDPLTKTSYQLDDQRKAQELVNKNVKVTGVLDPLTGTIRVSAIDRM